MRFQCNGNFNHVAKLSSVLGDILILCYLLKRKHSILINRIILYLLLVLLSS